MYNVTKNVLSLKSKISEIRTELLLALNYSQNTRTFPLPQLVLYFCNLFYGNSTEIFDDKAVITIQKNRTNYRNTKQVTEAEVGRFLYFDCNNKITLISANLKFTLHFDFHYPGLIRI